MKTIGVVYRIICNENDNDYIGMTTDLYNRIQSHFRDLKNGKHPYLGFQSDFNKYGISAFRVDILFKAEYINKSVARHECRIKERELMISMKPKYNPLKFNTTPKHVKDELILSKDSFEVFELIK